jgi:hypothetical protein
LLSIREVATEQDKNVFIKLPWKIYKENKYWVPPLLFDVKNNLDPNKNPFFKHAEVGFFLAFNDDKPVGRIAAIKNELHNQFHKENIGFFGFFECINDQEVANKLFDTAIDWCKQRKLTKIVGPMNPSTNDECGLLIDAYDQSPVFLMPYNHSYYRDLIEKFGFVKEKDLLAYFISPDVIKNEKMMAKLERMANMIKAKQGITIRKLNLKDFNNEVRKIEEIYNDAWEYNWGFVPMTTEEFDYMAKNLKAIVDTDFVVFAEVNGIPAGFSLTLPDFNFVLKKLNGRIFPFGILKLLYYKNKIDVYRVITMGVKKEFQKRGIDSVFYLEAITCGNKKKLKGAEISWVLEDNLVMRQTAEKLGSQVYKTYRAYSYNLK